MHDDKEQIFGLTQDQWNRYHKQVSRNLIILFLVGLPLVLLAKAAHAQQPDDGRLEWRFDSESFYTSCSSIYTQASVQQNCDYKLSLSTGVQNKLETVRVANNSFYCDDRSVVADVHHQACYIAYCKYGSDGAGGCNPPPPCPVESIGQHSWTGATNLVCISNCSVQQVGDSNCTGVGSAQVCSAEFAQTGEQCEMSSSSASSCPDGYMLQGNTCAPLSSSSASSEAESSASSSGTSDQSASSQASDTVIPDPDPDNGGDDGGSGGGGGDDGGGSDGGGGGDGGDGGDDGGGIDGGGSGSSSGGDSSTGNDSSTGGDSSTGNNTSTGSNTSSGGNNSSGGSGGGASSGGAGSSAGGGGGEGQGDCPAGQIQQGTVNGNPVCTGQCPSGQSWGSVNGEYGCHGNGDGAASSASSECPEGQTCEGTFGGGECNSESPTAPKCEGDADPIVCAVAIHTWQTECNDRLWRDDLKGTDEFNNGDSLLDTNNEKNLIPEFETDQFTQGANFNSGRFGGSAASCPAPRTVSVMSGNITFSFEFICQFAGLIRNIVLAIAYFLAALIYIRGFLGVTD